MTEFDVDRLRMNWNRAAGARPPQCQASETVPEAAAPRAVGMMAIAQDLSRLVEQTHAGRYPVLHVLLSELRSCCGTLSGGGEAAGAATRALDLIQQLEDLLEAYGGIGLRP